jgi:hypothetical protein
VFLVLIVNICSVPSLSTSFEFCGISTYIYSPYVRVLSGWFKNAKADEILVSFEYTCI